MITPLSGTRPAEIADRAVNALGEALDRTLNFHRRPGMPVLKIAIKCR
jgi:hypothetical protein